MGGRQRRARDLGIGLRQQDEQVAVRPDEAGGVIDEATPWLPSRANTAYAASKHAVAGLTKALANEWASLGINVNGTAADAAGGEVDITADGTVETGDAAHHVTVGQVIEALQHHLGEPAE